jgi:LysM repeat protein
MFMRRTFIVLLILMTTALVLTPLLAFASTAEQTCGPGVVHVVVRGENLFRISLRYGTSMSAIANANGIVNYNLIYAGQQLVIPCASGQPQTQPQSQAQLQGLNANPTFLNAPVVVIPPAGVQPIALVDGEGSQSPLYAPLTADCSRFRATSPLQGLNNGSNVFYWDPAPGATSYRVNIYNFDLGGTLMASYEVNGLLSRLQGDVSDGAVGGGFRFGWEVQALVNDQIACSSPLLTMFRAVAPTPVPTAGP